MKCHRVLFSHDVATGIHHLNYFEIRIHTSGYHSISFRQTWSLGKFNRTNGQPVGQYFAGYRFGLEFWKACQLPASKTKNTRYIQTPSNHQAIGERNSIKIFFSPLAEQGTCLHSSAQSGRCEPRLTAIEVVDLLEEQKIPMGSAKRWGKAIGVFASGSHHRPPKPSFDHVDQYRTYACSNFYSREGLIEGMETRCDASKQKNNYKPMPGTIRSFAGAQVLRMDNIMHDPLHAHPRQSEQRRKTCQFLLAPSSLFVSVRILSKIRQRFG